MIAELMTQHEAITFVIIVIAFLVFFGYLIKKISED